MQERKDMKKVVGTVGQLQIVKFKNESMPFNIIQITTFGIIFLKKEKEKTKQNIRK